MKTVLAEPLSIDKADMAIIEEELSKEGHEFIYYDNKPKDLDDWNRRIEDCDQLIIANSKLPDEVVKKAKNLKYINVAFTGLDHIPMKICQELGIKVTNAAGYSDQGVAEEVLGLAIALLRKFKSADKAIREGGKGADFLGGEIFGRTVGIIGTGRIGTRTAELFKAFGAKLIGYNRTKYKAAEEIGIKYVSLEELLKKSDIITVHLPMNDETRDFLTSRHFSMMKDTAILINCARGPVVNSKDLAEALKNGVIAGAGLDVFNEEPPLTDEALLDAPNTILMPHVAYFTEEAMKKRAKIVLENAKNYLFA